MIQKDYRKKEMELTISQLNDVCKKFLKNC